MFDRLAAALANRRFRWVLLGMLAVPTAAMYVAVAVVLPLRTAGVPGLTDFGDVYYPASRALLQGQDPYRIPCTSHYSCDPIFAPVITAWPPAMHWVLEPLAALDFTTADVLAVLLANVLLLATIGFAIAAARVTDRQVAVAAALLGLAFGPAINQVQNRQPQLLLSALVAAWAWSYASGRRDLLGGAALGAGAAIKLQPGPLLLLVAWRGRWAMVAGAAAAALLITALASPQQLPEYVTSLLPRVSSGNGYWFNVSLAGAIDRVLQPDSFWGRTAAVSPLVRPLALIGFALAALVTARVARKRPADRDGRVAEVAAASVVALLASPLVWFGHLVLLIPAMVALLAVGLRRRRAATVAGVLGAWVCMGPAFQLAGALVAQHPNAHGLIYPAVQVGLAGQLLLWLTALYELRAGRQPSPALPALAAPASGKQATAIR